MLFATCTIVRSNNYGFVLRRDETYAQALAGDYVCIDTLKNLVKDLIKCSALATSSITNRLGTMVLGYFLFFFFQLIVTRHILIMRNSIQSRLKYDKKGKILLITLFRFNIISITKLISRF